MTAPPERPGLFDAGLQPERTALAWRRTGLALCAGSLIAVRVLAASLGPWAMIPAGMGVAGSVVIVVLAHRRHLRTVDTLRAEEDGSRMLPSGRLPLAVALASVGAGVAALGVVLTTS